MINWLRKCKSLTKSFQKAEINSPCIYYLNIRKKNFTHLDLFRSSEANFKNLSKKLMLDLFA